MVVIPASPSGARGDPEYCARNEMSGPMTPKPTDPRTRALRDRLATLRADGEQQLRAAERALWQTAQLVAARVVLAEKAAETKWPGP